MIVILGELGGKDEYGVVEALKAGAITKPVIAWVSGTCAALFKSEVQFGHAGENQGCFHLGDRSTSAWLPGSLHASNDGCVVLLSHAAAALHGARLFRCNAGARSGGELESAQAKNMALREAGALVPESFEGLEAAIRCACTSVLLAVLLLTGTTRVWGSGGAWSVSCSPTCSVSTVGRLKGSGASVPLPGTEGIKRALLALRCYGVVD